MFAHLHVRSWFSFLAGGSSPEDLAEHAAGMGMGALALTDLNGVYGVVRFQQACRRRGIRPVTGAEVHVADAGPLVLLARTLSGYANLCRILSAAHAASHERPAVGLDVVAAHAGDLICLSGGRDGLLHRLMSDRREREATAWLARLRDAFGEGLHVELAHYSRPHDGALIERLHGLALRMGIAPVATGDVRYARREHYPRYDLATCTRLGITVHDRHPERPVNGASYLRSEAGMRRIIPFPDAVERSGAIAAECSVDLLPEIITTPGAVIPPGSTAREYLMERCSAALFERYPAAKQETAMAQLRREIAVVSRLSLEEFFLVVSEVTAEARRRGIRCAGRGSAANSIIAYLLRITGVDPLEHHLLFERFLHGGRKSIPDIDVDFDSERREEIIAWMEERFGHEQTAMTATVITYGLRMAVRDVAKALGWPREAIDATARLLPHGDPCDVTAHREAIAEALGSSPLVDVLVLMTAGLQGCPRHLGLHSGGMILSRRPLENFTPLQRSANGVTMVQFDKNDVERLGLVKLDVLGLRMLATLSETLELVERHMRERIELDDLPLDDPATFDLIRSGRTLGTFQIESQGQMHLLALNQPETFNDLIAEVALFRPGPVQSGMVKPFVARRRGTAPVAYDHPDLEPILRDTYGVLLFQEQVLEIAHLFAGMPMDEADSFRSLMSKLRSASQMEEMRGRFVGGAVRRGVPEPTAQEVFNKVSHFVGYGFCRSHAAAFAKTVYQSCWLKRHHPAAYMAAVMQHRPGMYSLNTLEEEAKRFGVPVLLPEINRSGVRYELEQTADGAWAIRKPLAAITTLSADDARAIAMERLNGPYTSVEDCYARVPLGRDTWEHLARSGAFDALAGSSRRALWEVGVLARRLGASGQRRAPMLFDLPAIEEADIPALPELRAQERLAWDYLAHGAARAHPMTLVRRALTMLEIRSIGTYRAFGGMAPEPGGRPDAAPGTAPRPPIVTIAGVSILKQRPPTANGVLFLTLEDETGFIQCIVYPALQELHGAKLRSGALVVRGELQMVGAWRGMVVRDVWALDGMLGGYEGYPSAYGGTDRLVVPALGEAEPNIEGYQMGLFEGAETAPATVHVPRNRRRRSRDGHREMGVR